MDKYAKLFDEAVGALPEDKRDEASRDRDVLMADFKDWTSRARVNI